jgi:hypothetical protein
MTKRRFKDFGSGAELAPVEPLSFKLHGEEFKCLPRIQGKVFLEFIEHSASDDGAETAKVISSFFGKVLEDESVVRFDALLTSKDKIVTVESLSEIVAWLLEEYSARPEGEPKVS